MSYLQLTKKALTGKLIACTNFKDGSFVNLIEIQNPHKDGTKYTVHETTKSSFCSNGLFKELNQAILKYNRMIVNGSIESDVITQFTKIGEYTNHKFNYNNFKVLSFNYEFERIGDKVFRIEPKN